MAAFSRSRRRPLAALAVLALALTACSAATSATEGGSSASAGGASSTQDDGASASSSSGPLTLAFAGDVHFTGRTAGYPADPAPMVAALTPVADADIAVVNLETAITDRGSTEPKQFHFRAPASSLPALQQAGVDAVSLANNHGVDYGEAGLQDSLAAQADSPIPIVGLGKNADAAFAPALLKAKGRTVAVIGASQVNDRTLQAWSASEDSPGIASALKTDRLVAAVKDARSKADVVVVFLHWGVERMACPTRQQKTLAETLTEAGADVVVGSHPHRIQGAGWLSAGGSQSYVDFSLGNFLWWRSNGKPAVTTGVLTLTMDGRRASKAVWTPMLIDDKGLPHTLSGSQQTRELADWNKARACTGLSATPG